ncbi:hypothetical protein Tco_1223026, partial [Tanacetum coccineum]
DPSEDSLPPAPDLPLVSPFLCFDDSEANSSDVRGAVHLIRGHLCLMIGNDWLRIDCVDPKQ